MAPSYTTQNIIPPLGNPSHPVCPPPDFPQNNGRQPMALRGLTVRRAENSVSAAAPQRRAEAEQDQPRDQRYAGFYLLEHGRCCTVAHKGDNNRQDQHHHGKPAPSCHADVLLNNRHFARRSVSQLIGVQPIPLACATNRPDDSRDNQDDGPDYRDGHRYSLNVNTPQQLPLPNFAKAQPSSITPARKFNSNVITLPRRHCSPPRDVSADGSCRTGQTRIRDRWFGIPVVEEKVIYRCGEIRWRRVRPPPHPMDPVQAASYIVGPTVWLAAILGLWWLL